MTVDIIIPCYYSSEIIRPCLESVAQQTVIQDITVIMVNDCSPYTKNEYYDLRNEFENQFKLSYYCTPTHGGPAAARQLGLDEAKSDWIMFIDDDDELYNSTAIEQLLNLANLETVISVTGQSIFEGTNEVMPPWIHHHGSIYNRKLLQKNNIRYDPRLSYEEDGAFSRKIMYTPDEYQKLKLYEIIYRKKMNRNSLTSKTSVMEERILSLIGLATLNLQYVYDAQRTQDIIHDVFYDSVIIKNLLYQFVIDQTLQLTKKQYSILLSFIIQYNNLTKVININDIDGTDIYNQSINFQNTHFNFNNYRYSIEPVINYDNHYLEWLMAIFLKIKD